MSYYVQPYHSPPPPYHYPAIPHPSPPYQNTAYDWEEYAAWQDYKDEEGRTCYYNQLTQQFSWVRPAPRLIQVTEAFGMNSPDSMSKARGHVSQEIREKQQRQEALEAMDSVRLSLKFLQERHMAEDAAKKTAYPSPVEPILAAEDPLQEFLTVTPAATLEPASITSEDSTVPLALPVPLIPHTGTISALPTGIQAPPLGGGTLLGVPLTGPSTSPKTHLPTTQQPKHGEHSTLTPIDDSNNRDEFSPEPFCRSNTNSSSGLQNLPLSHGRSFVWDRGKGLCTMEELPC